MFALHKVAASTLPFVKQFALNAVLWVMQPPLRADDCATSDTELYGMKSRAQCVRLPALNPLYRWVFAAVRSLLPALPHTAVV